MPNQAYQCPRCGYINLNPAHFCGMCGTELPSPCPKCGQVNPPEYQFCFSCGQEIGKIAQPQKSGIEDVKIEINDKHPSAPAMVERRIATILMLEVYKGTEILENIGIEAWAEVIGKIIKIAEEQIEAFAGQINQFRGESIIAFFGVDNAHEDDPERAVLAGMAIQKKVRELFFAGNHIDETSIQIRMGINTGEIITTRMGKYENNQEDTAMGEAISIAARLQTSAEPGSIMVSENTYALIKKRFFWLPLGKIRVKGISNPIEVYRPIS